MWAEGRGGTFAILGVQDLAEGVGLAGRVDGTDKDRDAPVCQHRGDDAHGLGFQKQVLVCHQTEQLAARATEIVRSSVL